MAFANSTSAKVTENAPVFCLQHVDDRTTRSWRAMPGILPKMSIGETLDVTRIYSIADRLLPDVSLNHVCTFWVLNRNISHARLDGMGN
jgi:hypothetical protein